MSDNVERITASDGTSILHNNSGTLQENDEKKKVPYPKAVGFIISNEFCERFMYYGLRAILVLYLTRQLTYDDDTATIIYHVFSTLVYFFGVFGAIISDSWLGKFRTIFYLSIVYAVGGIIVSVGSIQTLYLPGRGMTILGLTLIAIGSGGIKPCVAAFGGDQFKLPEQVAQFQTYFSLFYLSINCGSLISSTVTPILRHDVSCFDSDECFPLAFGVPALLMILSIVIFVSGKFMYVIKPPAANMLVQVSKCIANAIATKRKSQKSSKSKDHWLDYAEEKFGKQLVNDTKALLKVLVLYIPLPVFWALYDQQGSRWTFQATRMDSDVGLFEIKPDQMLVLSSLLILIYIPMYDLVFYPLLAKIGIRRPLQKLTIGGILAGVSFLASAFVELELEKTYPVLPQPGESQIRIFNTFPCDYIYETGIPGHESIFLPQMDLFEEKHVKTSNSEYFSFHPLLGQSENCPSGNKRFNLSSETAISYFGRQGELLEYEDDPNKSRTGDPVLRILVNSISEQIVTVIDKDRSDQIRYNGTTVKYDLINLLASTYAILIDNTHILDAKIKQGAVLTLLIIEHENGTFNHNLHEISASNSMSILWLFPQYVIMGLGEVMYSVTGLQFSYSQAPDSMKSVVQACWLLTTAFGNVIDIIIVGSNFFSSQAHEFFLFAGIMFTDMILFIILAWRYKSVPVDQPLVPTTLTENRKL